MTHRGPFQPRPFCETMPDLPLAVWHTRENKLNNKILKYNTDKESNCVFHLQALVFQNRATLLSLSHTEIR